MSIQMYAFLYRNGGLRLDQIHQLCREGKITKEEFKEITDLNFDGISKSKKWPKD